MRFYVKFLHRFRLSNFPRKIVNIFLPINFNICFGCSKEPSHWDGSFKYPQHMFWLRNKKIKFSLRTLNFSPVSYISSLFICVCTSDDTSNCRTLHRRLYSRKSSFTVRAVGAVKRDFLPYIRISYIWRHTSQNEHFEYGYPQYSALLQFHFKLVRCSPIKNNGFLFLFTTKYRILYWKPWKMLPENPEFAEMRYGDVILTL